MSIALRIYQEEAVARLVSTAKRMLPLRGGKTVVFRAPTGSGKTIMMAEFLKRLIIDHEGGETFSVIWAAPRKLHIQSKRSLERYYFDSKALRCISFEDVIDKKLADREILFLNWESINKEKNIYIRDNENDQNLEVILQNTADAGRIIILVIDESHFAAETATSRALIQMIAPKVTIEVSATPNMSGDDRVTVQREDVVNEEMIKKYISVNPGFKNTIQQGFGDVGRVKSEAPETTEEFVIRMALDMRSQLKAAYEETESPVNPLLLIQLPDKRQGEEDKKEDVAAILRNKHGINELNRKLAVYLSEDKINLENLTTIDSEVEVMIFKQAIALGWDCPRASILVLLREWKSTEGKLNTFSIQTLGRILRMPELKHYSDERLNNAYVFTDVSDFSIEGDVSGSVFRVFSSVRSDTYSPISMKSAHAKRHREETRLSPEFFKVFAEAAEEQNLKGNIDLHPSGISATMVSDAVVHNSDLARSSLNEFDLDEADRGELTDRRRSPVEVNRVFNSFVRENLKPYAPEKRSVDRLSEALQRWLHDFNPFEFDLFGVRGQTIILNKVNRQTFIDVITRAKELYDQKVVKGKRDIKTTEGWEVGRSYTYGNEYNQTVVTKSILKPFFQSKNASKPERDFLDFLDNQFSGVEWWFKNGDHGSGYFGVPYLDEFGIDRVFYVDWIVQMTDGRIALFDTKEGQTAKEGSAKLKAEALARYISEENANGKKLVGGIVIHEGGSWRLNDNEVYEYNPNDLSKWKFVNQLGTGFRLSPE